MWKRIVLVLVTGLMALGITAAPAVADCKPTDTCSYCW
jgi:hypothetical protein